MAQFDLKNAMVYIRDGYSKTGAVNNAAGYTAGASTIVVDGFTTAASVGDLFKIAGDTSNTKYRATAATTTSLSFTPPLGAAITDNAVISVGPHELAIKLGDGNLTFSEKKNRQYVKDRGRLSTVRDGDEEPVDVKLDAIWEWLRASTGQPPSIEDVLKNRGVASNWITSAADPCEPYAVDIVIEYTPTCGGEDLEIITLADFRYEELPHDMKAGTISLQGKCNITEAATARVPQAA